MPATIIAAPDAAYATMLSADAATPTAYLRFDADTLHTIFAA